MDAKPYGKNILMMHTWAFEISFFDWARQINDPLQFPTVSWYQVERIGKTETCDVVAK
jgi:hypothetical protein